MEVLPFPPFPTPPFNAPLQNGGGVEDDPFVSEWVSQSGSYLPSATGRTVCTVQIRWRARRAPGVVNCVSSSRQNDNYLSQLRRVRPSTIRPGPRQRGSNVFDFAAFRLCCHLNAS